MHTRIHRAPMNSLRVMAERIYVKLQIMGTRQVRLHRGMLLTYPYPARRGYGTRGMLVGIYTLATRLEWIEEDISSVMSDSKPCGSDAQAV